MPRKVVLKMKKPLGNGCREGISFVYLASLFCKGQRGNSGGKGYLQNCPISWEPIYGQGLGAPHGLHAACGLPRKKFHKPGDTSSSERGAHLELVGDRIVDGVTCRIA